MCPSVACCSRKSDLFWCRHSAEQHLQSRRGSADCITPALLTSPTRLAVPVTANAYPYLSLGMLGGWVLALQQHSLNSGIIMRRTLLQTDTAGFETMTH